ncbi:MAG: type I methionyl aminopeptidase [Patescibacteria group bacterium]
MSGVTIKTAVDIEILRRAGKILADILSELEAVAKVGITSFELEKTALKLTKKAGAKPAFLGYTPQGASRPYPAALCLSINDVVVHGIPNAVSYTLKDGDLVTLDMGISYKGMIVDSATTIGVGDVDSKGKQLLKAGKEALDAAVEICKHWTEKKVSIKTGDIGMAIEKAGEYYRKTYGFNFAEGLGGHGVGYYVHEDPFIPNFGKPGQGVVLKPGMVIAIEPILNEGDERITLDDDDYTYRTFDGKRSVHFEHTVLITEKGAEVLTA